MSILQRKIGGKIAEIRLERKFTQAQLAEKMGLSVESVSRMERGVTFPSLKTMEKVGEALGVPLKSFFDFEDEDAKSDGFSRELSKLIAQARKLDAGELALLRRILKEIEKWQRKI